MSQKINLQKQKTRRVSVRTKQANDYERIAACYHEASHAIVALAHLMYVYEIDVLQLAVGTNGKVDMGQMNSYILDEKVINKDLQLQKTIITSHILMKLAGLVGEMLYYKDICGSDKFPMSLKVQSSKDLREASHLIRKYKMATPGTEARNLKKKYRQELEIFLTNYWEDVKATAHALYKKKSLNFDDLKKILIKNISHRDYWIEKFKKIKILWNENITLEEETIKALFSSKV